MTYTQGVVLGVVQGLTEFLPISSSGHLILIPRLLGWPDQGLAFDAVMHLGTVAALLAYFWPDVGRMASALWARGVEHGAARRLAGLLLVATIPGGLAGFLFGATIESRLRVPWIVATSLIGWALVMWLADRQAARRRNRTGRPEDVGVGPGARRRREPGRGPHPGDFAVWNYHHRRAPGQDEPSHSGSLLPFVLYRLGLGLVILGVFGVA